MEVKYVYNRGIPNDYKKEILLTKVVEKVSTQIDLPKQLIIEFSNLPQNNYGETVLDSRTKNRLRLNVNLGYKECVYVLTHELVHISQINCGQLMYSRNGDYLWEGKVHCSFTELRNMCYNDYKKLPWELDVVKKQQKILDYLLKN